jgi:hypothetical protein
MDRVPHSRPLRAHRKSRMMHFQWRSPWIPALRQAQGKLCAGAVALWIRTSRDMSFPSRRGGRNPAPICSTLLLLTLGYRCDTLRGMTYEEGCNRAHEGGSKSERR